MKTGTALAAIASGWLAAVAAAAQPAAQPERLTFSIVGKPGAAASAPSVRCVVDRGPAIPVAAVAFSPDGKTLAAAGYGEVLLWDLAKAQFTKRIGAGQVGDTVGALAFLPDGKRLAVGGGTAAAEGTLKLLDVESGEVAGAIDGPKDVVYCLAVSPDGKLLAAGSADGNAYVAHVDETKLGKTIDQHNGWVLDVAFSPDGAMLATAGSDRAAKVWNTGDWGLVQTLEEDEVVHGVAFAADNKQVAVAYGGPSGWGVTIRWIDNARRRRSLWYRGGVPLDVAWLPQGNNLLMALADNTLQSLPNLRPKTTFTGHADWIYALAVSPDGKTLASGSGDGTVKVWSVDDGRLRATLAQLGPRSGEWLAITPQGYLAVSSSGSLKWEMANVKTPPGELEGLLKKPELVAQVLAGEQVDAPAVP